MGCSASSPSNLVLRNELEQNGGSKTMVKENPSHSAICILNVEQRNSVRNTWNYISQDASLVGKKVFLRIFDAKPETKKLFPFRDSWGDELITHPQFQIHASRFMAMVGEAVKGLDSMGAFNDSMTALGRSHYFIEGFTPDYFEIFLKSLLFIWQHELRGRMDGDTTKAWQTLFEHLLGKLREGYDLEKYDHCTCTKDDGVIGESL